MKQIFIEFLLNQRQNLNLLIAQLISLSNFIYFCIIQQVVLFIKVKLQQTKIKKMDNQSWLADQCLQILGDKNKGTIQYLKSVAKKSSSLDNLQQALNDFDIPVAQNPRNKHFAAQLYQKFKQLNQTQKAQTIQAKKKAQYKLLDMNLGFNKNSFIKDQQVSQVKDAQMLRKQDKVQRDELSRRLIQKDKLGKSKLVKTNAKGVTLNQQQKLKILPSLREQSRMKFLDKRQKQQLQSVKLKLIDDKQLFDDKSLTLKELKMRQLKQKIVNLAQQNVKTQHKISTYKHPQQMDNLHQPKDKRLEVLHKKYQDVPNQQPQDNLWQKSQGKKVKGEYRTIDQIQRKNKKNYDLIINNSINFVKSNLLSKAKQIQNLQIDQEQSSSSSSSGSSSSSDSDSQGQVNSDSSGQLNQKKPSKKQIIKQKKQIKKSPMQIVKQSLPIYKYRHQLLKLIEDNQIIIMVGQTGSGKTTQLPQYLHQMGYTKEGKKIGCTQPRRVAAMSVATRVAQQMGCKLGEQVGYSIRFQDNTSQNTIIKYMTDGMLLRQFMIEPDLNSYSVMIVDEAHQRSLHTDIIITLIKDVCLQRKDIKVIISSATLQAQKFSKYFGGAPIIKIPGRRFPVDIYYTSNPQANYIEATVVTVLQIHLSQDNGDILCFMTGQDQIEQAMQQINNRLKGLGSKVKQMIVLPIYSGLPGDMQAKIFQPTPKGSRKVVLATNIAQTSLTIDNIVYVIDCGFVKQTAYNPRTGMDSLVVVPISKASANQRAGRAGRVAPGKCFRLYTLWSYEKQLEQSTIPQIQRSNIGNVILMLKSMGIDNLVDFDYLDPPPHDMLVKGLEMLYALGALNDQGELTKLGRRMAEFPLDPMLSKMLIASQKYKCVQQIIIICSMLSVGNAIFYRPKQKKMHADNSRKAFFRPGGDHLTLLNVYNQWREYNQSSQWCTQNFIQVRSLRRARDVKEQLTGLMERVEIDVNNQQLSIYEDDQNTNVRKCIVSGFFMNSARKYKDFYKTAKFHLNVKIHPSSMLLKDQPQCVVYHQLVLTTQEYMRNVIEVQPEWLVQIAPHFYKIQDFNTDNYGKKKKKADVQMMAQ